MTTISSVNSLNTILRIVQMAVYTPRMEPIFRCEAKMLVVQVVVTTQFIHESMDVMCRIKITPSISGSNLSMIFVGWTGRGEGHSQKHEVQKVYSATRS